MAMVIRQLVSMAALPFVVAIAIPAWIAWNRPMLFSIPDSPTGMALVGIGVALLVVGVPLFASSVFYFWSRGRGTLAPWDPPRVFVAEGPYQFVRNPMISGVMFVLWGEACILRSTVHAEWAGIFMLVNVIYIPLLEEPMLVARFGSPYIRYRRAVRRFIPRLHAWRSDTRDETSGAGAEA